MDNETLVASDSMPQEVISQPEASVGTSLAGQSSDQGNQPNDSEFMRADYTRKTQEVADMRRQVEADRQRLDMERSQYQQQYQQQLNQPQVTPQSQYQQLVDQLGTEAANAVWQQNQQIVQQNQSTQLELYKMQEEMKGRQKFGEAWDKHSYVDQMSGQVRNKVMDIRMSVNPITGQALTLEQAFAAAEITDVNSFKTQTEQQIRDKIYQEMSY